MNKDEIEKLLLVILEDSKLKDNAIIGLIYMLMEQIENTCYGYVQGVTKQRFDRLYKKLFEDIFQDLITDVDWFDELINTSLQYRNKVITERTNDEPTK